MPRREHLGHGRHPDEVAAERRGSSGSLPASRRPGRATLRRRPRRAIGRAGRRPRAREREVRGRRRRSCRGSAAPARRRSARRAARCPAGSGGPRRARDRPGVEILANAAAGVRDDERAGAEPRRARARRTTTRVGGMPFVEVGAPLHHRYRHARRTCRARGCRRARAPSTTGQPGISPYGISTASSIRSAKPPRPEPSTTAARGTSGVRSRIEATRVVDHADPSATRASKRETTKSTASAGIVGDVHEIEVGRRDRARPRASRERIQSSIGRPVCRCRRARRGSCRSCPSGSASATRRARRACRSRRGRSRSPRPPSRTSSCARRSA